MMYQQPAAYGAYGGMQRVGSGFGQAGIVVASPRGGAMSPAYGGYASPRAAYGSPVAAAPQVVQAPYVQQVYGQQVAYAQPAYGQPQVMYAQPGMMPFGQAAPVALTPQQKALCDKINSFSDYPMYMNSVKPYFDNIAGANGRVDMNGAQRFLTEAAIGLLGQALDSGAQVNAQEFQRYDFEGDGTLTFVECAKMLKGNMVEMQKRLGGAQEVPVPMKTPEQAGYQVGKVLAAGGQGKVALARGARGDVALKIYDKNNENAANIEDLRTEMEVMKALERCNHIMHSYEIFQDAQHFYCVDELLPGGDLCCLRKKAAEQGIALDETYFRNLFSQCVGALEYMHRHAMMHCDIKEPNIMFKTKDYRNPTIALIDFGMSKWSSSDGMAGGTPGYRPPETNETNVWFPRGDMFSMGVTFFQLLADKVPDEETMKPGIFTEGAQTMEHVVYFVQTRTPPWYLVQGKFPGVMAWLPSMLDKQMARRPTAPQLLLQTPWFQAPGAAADAVVPETAWIMPEPFNDADLADLSAPPAQQAPAQAIPAPAAPMYAPEVYQATPEAAQQAAPMYAPEVYAAAPQPYQAAPAPEYSVTPPVVARPAVYQQSPYFTSGNLAANISPGRVVQRQQSPRQTHFNPVVSFQSGSTNLVTHQNVLGSMSRRTGSLSPRQPQPYYAAAQPFLAQGQLSPSVPMSPGRRVVPAVGTYNNPAGLYAFRQ